MEGLLREKCVERGLSLPYLGGDVKMRAFLVNMLLGLYFALRPDFDTGRIAKALFPSNRSARFPSLPEDANRWH